MACSTIYKTIWNEFGSVSFSNGIFKLCYFVFVLYKSKVRLKIITGITVSFSTAEWLLIYGHWAMDCNIIVPIFIFMIGFAILSFIQNKIYGYITVILINLMSYCYVGIWISLPFLFIGILWFFYKCGMFNKKDIY